MTALAQYVPGTGPSAWLIVISKALNGCPATRDSGGVVLTKVTAVGPSGGAARTAAAVVGKSVSAAAKTRQNVSDGRREGDAWGCSVVIHDRFTYSDYHQVAGAVVYSAARLVDSYNPGLSGGSCASVSALSTKSPASSSYDVMRTVSVW